MKRYIILGALLVSAALAHAELGETKQQSANRYGKPFQAVGHVLYYKSKGYVIGQWYNEGGICELVSYFKLRGNITQVESDRIGAANLPGYVKRDDWIEQPSQNPNTHVWISLDYKWYFESGQCQLGDSKYLYAGVLIGTTRGVQQYGQETQSANTNQPSSETGNDI